MKRAAIALLLLGACSHGAAPTTNAADTNLEAAAIRAGVIDDPATADPVGLYASDGDRLCLVGRGDDERIGVSLDYGNGQGCHGTGTVARSGGTLHVSFAAAEGCEFDARFEGDRVLFSGSLPDACAALCLGRASLAGLSVDRLSDSASEAAAMRDVVGRRPCA